MSLHCLKKKGVILHGGGTRMMCAGSPSISGKGPGGFWITPLPFCNSTTQSQLHFSSRGFSINGGQRNVSHVGKIKRQYGTPFRGIYPKAYGGNNGSFTKSIILNMNSAKAELQGNQYKYIKPSSQTTKTMLKKKFHYIYHGQYPLNWVQPTYASGPLDQNASMSSYIQKLKTENSLYLESGASEGTCNSTCNAPEGYTKTIHQPVDESKYIQHIQRKCLNPVGKNKPFPFNALNNSNSGLASNTSINAAPPAIITEYYMVPPEWYEKADNCL